MLLKTLLTALKFCLLSFYTIYKHIKKFEKFHFFHLSPMFHYLTIFTYCHSPYMHFYQNFCQTFFALFLSYFNFMNILMFHLLCQSTHSTLHSLQSFYLPFPPVHSWCLLINVYTYYFNVWTTFYYTFRHLHVLTFQFPGFYTNLHHPFNHFIIILSYLHWSMQLIVPLSWRLLYPIFSTIIIYFLLPYSFINLTTHSCIF
jgi:hypothetical protein